MWYLFFSVWVTSLSIVISRSICVAANAIIISFYGQVIFHFHCVCVFVCVADNLNCKRSQVSLCTLAARKLKTQFETEIIKFMVSISTFLAPFCLLSFVVDYFKSFVRGNWEQMPPYLHQCVLINSSLYYVYIHCL